MKEPQFTPGPWRRTITTVPCVTECCDTSPDIVNLTIGDRNIPLVAVGMNSTVEGRELFAQMVANADMMAAAPEMYAEHEKVEWLLRNTADWLERKFGNILDVALLWYEAENIDALLAKARGEEKR